MCGINGITNFNLKFNKSNLINFISIMNNTIKHRGPDHGDYYINSQDKLIIGNRRLAIIDLESRSNQPLISRYSKNVISFNGEIYNYEYLKKELQDKGYKFYSKGDTEVISVLFDEYGIDFVSKLDGMFAISIWDDRNQKLYLIRDFFGKKPLYYVNCDGNLFFSSEINSLKKVIEDNYKTFCDENFKEFINFGYVDDNKTIFKKIRRLKPSSFIEVSKEKIEEKKYNYYHNFKKDINNYEQLLKRSINKRLNSDAKVGLLLSGGVDSSLILKYLGEKNINIKSYTINIHEKNNDKYLEAIGDLSKKYNIKNNIKNINSKSLLDCADKIYKNLSEPITDISIIPTFLAYEFASNECKVLLNGDGADEIFLGYRRHLLSKIVSLLNLKKNSFLDKFFNNTEIRLLRCLFSNDVKKIQHLSGNYYCNSDKDLFLADISPNSKLYSNFDNFNEKMIFHDLNNQLTNCLLIKADHCSMSNSVEARSPYLDKSVYFKSLGDNRNNFNSIKQTKIILRNLLSKSHKYISNLPKEGFDLKRKYIYQNNKNTILDKLNDSRSYIYNFINKKKLIKNFYNDVNFQSDIYWTAYSYILWEENN